MPFADSSFEVALCIEVLEHAEDPELLLREAARCLTDDGTLILTVPFSARRHHIPHDYHRFTRERLEVMLASAGFTDVRLAERGNDFGAIANKLIVANTRLLTPARRASLIWGIPSAVALAPVTMTMTAVAHVSDRVGGGSTLDPLGYFAEARK